MTHDHVGKVAILYPGDLAARQAATPQNNRLATIFKAMADSGILVEPAVYHDQFAEEVRRQLLQVDAVLVWMNPIQDGRDRSVLDPILREISESGIFVSSHPDIILKLGTKEVLYRTRDMEWGSDTHLYRTIEQLKLELPPRLAQGQTRVLKQYRGNGGQGVWKLEIASAVDIGDQPSRMPVKVLQAKRGSIEETMPLDEFFERCESYFIGDGRMIDQVYQSRLAEGMVRCYLVQDQVVGFGHQAVNALLSAPPGVPVSQAPQPGPRLYHPPDMPQFQYLKRKVEQDWVPEMQRRLDIALERLPILWDCDFLFGPKNALGEDTYVLCEINASSIAPYPESAPPYVAQAILAQLRATLKNQK